MVILQVLQASTEGLVKKQELVEATATEMVIIKDFARFDWFVELGLNNLSLLAPRKRFDQALLEFDWLLTLAISEMEEHSIKAVLKETGHFMMAKFVESSCKQALYLLYHLACLGQTTAKWVRFI